MRGCSPEEFAIVKQFLEGVQSGLSGRVIGKGRLAMVERDGIPFVVLCTQEAETLPKEVKDDAHAAGLPIGVLEDGQFHLDLQGAVLMARHTDRNCVKVTEHAARLFMYSRDIIGTSILSYDDRLRPSDACIVTNPRGEAVGIGLVIGSLKAPRSAVKAVHDLGSYLRDQDESDDDP